MMRWMSAYVPTPDADPVYLYTDGLVALVPERSLNNGQPSLHAHLNLYQDADNSGTWTVGDTLAGTTNTAAGSGVYSFSNLGPGKYFVTEVAPAGTLETAPAGTGYYTAIFSHLVGPSGRVTGIEYDPDLAARARANLAPYANVAVIEGDGTHVPFDAADVIYVNAGCTQPATRWLDGLADAGRLIMPMTSDQGFGSIAPERLASAGAVFRIERRAANYLVQWISPVAIFPCAGGRDEVSERAHAEAFTRGGWQKVTRLYRDLKNIFVEYSS